MGLQARRDVCAKADLIMMEVDELLISSLCSVCLNQRDERQLALKRIQQSSYIKLTSGNQTSVLDIEVAFQLLSNRSAVETHEAGMHVDVTLRIPVQQTRPTKIGARVTSSSDAEKTRIHVTIQAATPPSLRTRLRSMGPA
jgi:hypothetical protein